MPASVLWEVRSFQLRYILRIKETGLRIAACILAKNEAATIPVLLQQLASQTLLSLQDLTVDVHLVANGCTDDTVGRAASAAAVLDGTNAELVIHDLAEGGKSRSWNRAVHQLIAPGADYFLFVDSDIVFIHEGVLEELLRALAGASNAVACSGQPLKDIALKPRKSALDRFSLAVSRDSKVIEAINGSLYLVRAAALQDVWLPDETSAEDGFLNAMLGTVGFTRPPVPGRVISQAEPTHLYRAHSPAGFILHERRMIVATVINCWIFEHLWSLNLTEPAGPLIRRWNEEQPDWVDQLVKSRTKNRGWVIPRTLLLGRLSLAGKRSNSDRFLSLITGMLATMVTAVPAFAANHRLKQVGATKTW